MRAVFFLLWCLPGAALAHAVGFDFVAPAGPGNGPTPSGNLVLQWQDSGDALDVARVSLFLVRDDASPFGPEDAGVPINAEPIRVRDPLDLFTAKASAFAPGCYLPYAQVFDPIEGSTRLVAAPGKVTVPRPDGGLPPSLWISTAAEARPSDAGALGLTFALDTPEVAELSVEWWEEGGARGVLASGLPIAAGTKVSGYTVFLAQLPPAGTAFLKATVTAADGLACTAWWAGAIIRGDAVDAGVDGGVLQPGSDGGMPPSDAGAGEPPAPRGCGCSSAGGELALALLAGVLGRRDSRERGAARPDPNVPGSTR